MVRSDHATLPGSTLLNYPGKIEKENGCGDRQTERFTEQRYGYGTGVEIQGADLPIVFEGKR